MSTVTVVATVEAGNTPPRVKLVVTDTGSPNLFAATVTRLNPDGSVVPVRTTDGGPLTLTTSGSNRVGTVYDYEMPLAAAVTYSTAETPTNTTGEVTVSSSSVWLVHPGVPELSMPISVAEFGDQVRAVQQSVLWPMGRKSPVIRTDGQRRSPQGVVHLNTLTLEQKALLEALTEDASALLLNIPAGLGWGVPACYVNVGDITEVRLVTYAGEPRRVHSLPYFVVDRPTGGSQAERTLADLLVYATLGDIGGAYPTLADVLAGP